MISNIGVLVILINQKSQVLLAKRKNAYGAGTWGCQGGRFADLENIDQCVKRELMEEAGLIPKQWRLLGVVKEWQETKFFVHFIVVCTDWKGLVALKEPNKSEPWHWFDLNRLPEPILIGHKKGIELYLSEKQSKSSTSNWFVEI